MIAEHFNKDTLIFNRVICFTRDQFIFIFIFNFDILLCSSDIVTLFVIKGLTAFQNFYFVAKFSYIFF